MLKSKLFSYRVNKDHSSPVWLSQLLPRKEILPEAEQWFRRSIATIDKPLQK